MANKDDIITLPNKHLRETSKRVPIITPELQTVIEDMKSATLDWEASRKHELGVALAAIQIDKPYRIVVIREDFDDKNNHNFQVFINPEITKLEGEIISDFEGCLSVADIYGKVPRYSKVRVKALNEDGKEIRVKAEGFLARIFQHEIDHTHGKLFIDHIKGSDNFYKINADGELSKLEPDEIKADSILWE